MPGRKAHARWTGSIRDGKGQMKAGSGAFDVPFSFRSRFENEPATNPEELIGAAHAGCFSMAFSKMLGDAGFEPRSIETTAEVKLEQQGDGFSITHIQLDTEGDVPGIDEQRFRQIAEQAKAGCPVSKVLAGAQIDLNARLR